MGVTPQPLTTYRRRPGAGAERAASLFEAKGGRPQGKPLSNRWDVGSVRSGTYEALDPACGHGAQGVGAVLDRRQDHLPMPWPLAWSFGPSGNTTPVLHLPAVYQLAAAGRCVWEPVTTMRWVSDVAGGSGRHRPGVCKDHSRPWEGLPAGIKSVGGVLPLGREGVPPDGASGAIAAFYSLLRPPGPPLDRRGEREGREGGRPPEWHAGTATGLALPGEAGEL